MGFFTIFWWVITVITITRIEEYDPVVIFRVGSVIAVSVGVYVAVWVHYSNTLWRRSEAYLEKCEDLLDKAYLNFTAVLDDEGRPLNNRRVWLNTARMIQACIHLSKKITDQGHKETYIEIEQYWRGRFYDILQPGTEQFPETYYAATPEKFLVYGNRDQEPLAGRSLAAIYRFIKWPEYAVDPLDSVSEFTEEEIEKFKTFGPQGLGRLMQAVNDLPRGR